MNIENFLLRKSKNDKHKIHADMGRYCVLCGEHGPCEGSSLEEIFNDLLKRTQEPLIEVKYLFDKQSKICNYCIADLNIEQKELK